MEKMRTFIAIELPPHVKTALARHRALLKTGDGKLVKWVEPENMHLTLQFMGGVPQDNIGAITTAISNASAGFSHFQLELAGLGVFPNPNRVQVIWVGLSGDLGILNRLQKEIGAGLTPLGFMPETRPFSPHLTLGRVKDHARPEERAKLGQILEHMPFNARLKIDVTSVNLMKSQLTPKGPIYTKLSEIKLK